jgi:phosphoribosyl-ATP pyrophosphohydrolase/phosphoribosyl-AMP cyclohydrolase
MTLDPGCLDYGKGGGVITVVAQDARTGRVLMVAAADREAVERSVATGEMHYRSRTRGPWHKGATSGSVQAVVSLAPDCDADAVLARVIPAGPSCHTGAASCFGRAAESADILLDLDRLIATRAVVEGAAGIGYTGRLLADRNLRLKKLGEEAAELAVACADGDRDRAAEEAADLLYHAMVAVHGAGGSLVDVLAVLARRRMD